MNLKSRFILILSVSAGAPVLLFALLEVWRRPPAAAAAFAALPLLLVWFCSRLMFLRVIRPVESLVAGIRGFRAADNRLEKIIPPEGWPELRDLAGAMNAAMLELQSYRAFQLNLIMEERNKAQALIEAITDGLILMDDRGALIHSNHAALSLLGIPRLSPDVLIPAAVKNESFRRELAAVMGSGEQFMKSEFEAVPLPSASGGETPAHRHYRLIASRFMLTALKRQGCVVTLRDITAEVELEKAKDAFFHMITHDMRSPLATIQGYAEILMKKTGSAAGSEKFFRSMLYSVRRLRGMIDDILNVTSLQRGVLVPVLSGVSAGALLARIAEQHEPVITPKKLRVELELPQPDAEFSADPALLERVLSNLLGNALKATPAGGVITMGASSDEENVVFWVRDGAPGIPEEKRTALFEKISVMERDSGQGLGLALAVCRMTVELHKGRIWVESAPGGNKFLFTVSRKLEPAPQKA